jgi:two-component system sensor histidine kinase RegB
MGQRGKDDAHVQHAPVTAVIDEAAEPHRNRGKAIILRVDGLPMGQDPAPGSGSGSEPEPEQPLILRQAEIIHGLRNLIQNGVDFAATTVWVDVGWTKGTIRLVVGDDGPGYPPELIGRIGDPFVRRRKGIVRTNAERPEYQGMGLGLFIAKTLLERTGARLTFANGSDESGPALPGASDRDLARPTGALVEVVWRRDQIEIPKARARASLGRNEPIRA